MQVKASSSADLRKVHDPLHYLGSSCHVCMSFLSAYVCVSVPIFSASLQFCRLSSCFDVQMCDDLVNYSL